MSEKPIQDARPLASFGLGQHLVALLEDADGGLSLWLDGCLRKRRGARHSAAYLWTNVELPFEDHHLVEVRRAAGPGAEPRITVNGAPVDWESGQDLPDHRCS